MPVFRYQASIDVRAPRDAAFAIVAGDLTATHDDPEALVVHRPLDDGSIRPGYRREAIVHHERETCRAEWTVTEVERPLLIAQRMHHFCAVADREVDGGERWEFEKVDEDLTMVHLRVWRRAGGVSGWLRKLVGDGMSRSNMFELRRQLLTLQHRAELHASHAGA